MEINQLGNYTISRNNETFGPYPGGELFKMAQSRQINFTDLLWTEGMAQWVQADSFPQIKVIIDASVGHAPQSPNPVGPSVQPIGRPQRPGNSPSPRKPTVQRISRNPSKPSQANKKRGKGASFGLLLFSFFLFVAVLIGPALLGLVVFNDGTGEPGVSLLVQFIDSGITENQVVMPIIVGLMIAALSLFPVMNFVYVYRGWKYLQDVPTATTSPGAAAGFLLIPIFNWVWIFFAYLGWAKNYNIRKNLTFSKSGPRVTESLFLVHCIFTLFGLPVLYPFVMFEMCRGVNYLAEVPPLDRSRM